MSSIFCSSLRLRLNFDDSIYVLELIKVIFFGNLVLVMVSWLLLDGGVVCSYDFAFRRLHADISLRCHSEREVLMEMLSNMNMFLLFLTDLVLVLRYMSCDPCSILERVHVMWSMFNLVKIYLFMNRKKPEQERDDNFFFSFVNSIESFMLWSMKICGALEIIIQFCHQGVGG